MDQGVRYVVTIDGRTQAISVLRDMESAAVRTESSIMSLNAALKGMAGAFGVGFGLNALVSFGKDAVQGAADYETAVKRIKFASNSLAEGAENIAFIGKEVDKFRIPLQQATDDYGKFLAQVAGSGMATSQVQKLHDELLMIGKIKGLDMGQLSAGVMNLGKMLEAGAMDARHLRPLEQQLSGIGKFIADEMGTTVHELAKLRNKGKLTDIDPVVLLRAIEKQAKSLAQFLPESLTTINSEMADVGNAWLRFKNDLVFENRADLQSLFTTLKDSISWMSSHKSEIIATGKAILLFAEAWLKVKTVMAAINLVSATRQGLLAGLAGETVIHTRAVTAQALAYNELAIAMQRLNYVAATQAGMPTLAAMSAARAAELEAGALTAGAAAGAGVKTVAAGGGLLASAGKMVIPVAIAYFTADAIGQMFPFTDARGESGNFIDKYPWQLVDDMMEKRRLRTWARDQGYSSTQIDFFDENGYFDKLGRINTGYGTVSKEDQVMNLAAMGLKDPMSKPYNPYFDQTKFSKADKGGTRITPPNDRIAGQRPVTYNINIKEINGIKENKVSEGAKLNTDDVANKLRDIIISIVNDSQLRADH